MKKPVDKNFFKLFQNKTYAERLLYLLDGDNFDSYLEDILYKHISKKRLLDIILKKIFKKNTKSDSNIDISVLNAFCDDSTICVMSPYYEDGKGGYYTRINQIDESILKRYRIIYLSCVNTLNKDFVVKKADDRHMVVYFNSMNSQHIKVVGKIVDKVRKIYIHGLYVLMPDLINSDLLEILFNDDNKVYYDVHGVADEELKMNNDELRSILASYLEKNIIYSCDKIICVSEQMKDYYIEKYGLDESLFMIIPMLDFDEIEIDKIIEKKHKDGKPTATYSGGLDKWQNIELMNDVIEKTINNINYNIFVLDTNAYKDTLSNNVSDRIRIETKKHDELTEEYLSADYGFVLRQDNLVNRVACPTKLIEYINYGVIPVLLSDNIGDFKKFGLKYISYEDLMNNNLPDYETRINYIKSNLAILKEMKNRYNYGTIQY